MTDDSPSSDDEAPVPNPLPNCKECGRPVPTDGGRHCGCCNHIFHIGCLGTHLAVKHIAIPNRIRITKV